MVYPFGAERGGDALPTDFAFTGQRHDTSTGLYFFHARYYHGGLGRFVSADTIVPEPGNPQSLNRYSYVYNNMMRYVDPSGHGICDGPRGQSNPDCQDYQYGDEEYLTYEDVYIPSNCAALSGTALACQDMDPVTKALFFTTFLYPLAAPLFAEAGLADLVAAAKVGGGAASAGEAALAACGGDCSDELATLYRFSNSAAHNASRLSRLPAFLQRMVQGLDRLVGLDRVGEWHAQGFVTASPYVSTLEDIVAGASTTDPWLRGIINNAQYLFELSVPTNLLYYPSNALSVAETEVLVLASDLAPFVVSVMENPFRGILGP